MRRRRVGSALCAAGGLALLAAGSSGSASLYETVLALAAERAPVVAPVLLAIGLALGVLAGLGGVTVLVGAWVIRRRSAHAGAFLVRLGCGFGVVGLAFHVAFVAGSGLAAVPLLLASLATLGGLGVVLAVAGAAVAAPLPVRAWWRRVRRVAR